MPRGKGHRGIHQNQDDILYPLREILSCLLFCGPSRSAACPPPCAYSLRSQAAASGHRCLWTPGQRPYREAAAVLILLGFGKLMENFEKKVWEAAGMYTIKLTLILGESTCRPEEFSRCSCH
jgi:hypothetical protein